MKGVGEVEPLTRVYAAEEVDDDIYRYHDDYYMGLMNPSEDMIASRKFMSRSEYQMTNLDAVARIGLLSGRELNSVYIYAAEMCTNSGECPEKTYMMLFDSIMKYPNDPSLEPVKKAVILYCLSLFEEMQHTYCSGNNGAGIITHEPINKEAMEVFMEHGLRPCVEQLSRCSETPHIFVHNVMQLVEDGGVLGYLQRCDH